VSRRLRIDARFAIAGVLAVIAAAVVLTLTRPVERVPVLVAASPLPPGVRLADLDLETRMVEPIEGVITAEDRPDFDDRVLAVPVPAGSPIMAMVLMPPASQLDDVMAVTLDPANAVQGDLRPGDLVDLYATDDTGTRRIAESVTVIDVSMGSGGFGGSDVAVLLSVDRALAQQVVAVTHTGALDLVRRGR
jgi:Flp pilus assembly protein CpaB